MAGIFVTGFGSGIPFPMKCCVRPSRVNELYCTREREIAHRKVKRKSYCKRK